MKDDAKRYLGFLAGLVIVSTSLTLGFEWAREGLFLHVFLAAFAAWNGYMLAHYSATGRFIDIEITEEQKKDMGLYRSTVALAGVLVLIAGITVAVVGIKSADLVIANAGILFFLGGYVVMHYAFTGELL